MQNSDLSISRRSAAELLDLYALSDADLSDIRDVGNSVTPMIDAMLDRFYDWMGKYPEMMAYFRDESVTKPISMIDTELEPFMRR